MAAKPYEEGKPFVQGIVDESCNLLVNYSGVKIVKPSFDEVKHQCSQDVLPILVEEASLPKSLKYPKENSHTQDVYSISVLPQESNNLQCASQLAFLRILEVPNPPIDQVCMDAELNCQNCIDFQMTSADTYSSCVVDIDMERESLQVPESNEKTVEILKTESAPIHLQKALRRQASINVGEKLIQLLVNYGTTSPRDKTDRVHEVTNNHWRRYKRATSFDSRKIVLLFSILSSVGTLVLIYLTLKVRQQIADGIIHV
ncbi:hypothetical protein L484_022121 [Morus notabilis]|uniref:Uncharacterized protein n=1 Tax=Morus notabilis TaxID=981085 RepID=W9QDS2_9ROSA|nr:uncharacterized protein LOC21404944 isoform X2 [Morus notabilis]EXB29450.1 hypothetical protein L484_022121 [Morus notabilis]